MPYHWGRYRGLAAGSQEAALLQEHLLNNVFFDTCVYHQPGIDLLIKVIPVDNILFASEMVGAVRGIDPETGNYYDDTKRYVDQLQGSADEDRHKIFEGNAGASTAALEEQDPRACAVGERRGLRLRASTASPWPTFPAQRRHPRARAGAARLRGIRPADIESAIALPLTPTTASCSRWSTRPWDRQALRDALQYMLNRRQIAQGGLARARA